MRETEVVERPTRQRFTTEYKLSVLREADACGPGEVGAVLRREGLYSSHLTMWRKQRAAGVLVQGEARRRGRPAKMSVQERELERLRRDNERLRHKLMQAEKIIEAQKKLSELLRIPLDPPGDDEKY